jgi:type 1 glutamine amidotransferase
MKRSFLRREFLALLLSVLATPLSGAEEGRIRVLLVYGGHDFQTNELFSVFQNNPEIDVRPVEQPQAQEWFGATHASQYDVLVFYDMWQNLSESAKRGLIGLLKDGKGLVALHHSLCSYQGWDEYPRIIGGRYHLQKWTDKGVEKPASTYKHDVDCTVRVADPNHPVTRGIQDFKIHDETYGGFEVGPESHVLLTTDEPTSGPKIAWTTTYAQARVATIQLGHDAQAYRNPNFQRLLAQALRWTARRDGQ